jgi:L-methionine (R)-S-oxide reductase
VDDTLNEIVQIINSSDEKTAKAKSIARVVRSAGGYRWVGIYDVNEQEVSNIAWSGKGAPAYPRFPVNQGLSADAVSHKRTVVSNVVSNDPRYLTAFGNTQSEIIVPIVDHRNDRVSSARWTLRAIARTLLLTKISSDWKPTRAQLLRCGMKIFRAFVNTIDSLDGRCYRPSL